MEKNMREVSDKGIREISISTGHEITCELQKLIKRYQDFNETDDTNPQGTSEIRLHCLGDF